MRRDLAGGQAAGGQRQHDLVDAVQPPLPLAHDLRVEAAIPVPRDLDLDRTDLGEHRLCPSAVARVAASAADRVVLVVAEVVAHLFLECGLHDRLRQAREQATPADQLHTLGTRLVDQFLSKLPLVNVSRHGLDRLGHYRSFPAKQRSAYRASYTVLLTVPSAASGRSRPDLAAIRAFRGCVISPHVAHKA